MAELRDPKTMAAFEVSADDLGLLDDGYLQARADADAERLAFTAHLEATRAGIERRLAKELLGE